MISFDKTYKQVLTTACSSCSDTHFQPPIEDLPRVGCCSYSPLFKLYEINTMIKKDKPFFLSLISQKTTIVNLYSIVIPAAVHPDFYKENLSSYSKLEKDDIKTSYSICRFFKENIGCSLEPSFKNSVCRSFICSTVEEALPPDKNKQLQKWTKQITREPAEFHHTHKVELQKRGINLLEHLDQVIHYLERV